jgi:hypothetical protein
MKAHAALSSPVLRKSRGANPPTQRLLANLNIFARRSLRFVFFDLRATGCDQVERRSTQWSHTNPGMWEPCSGGRFFAAQGEETLAFPSSFQATGVA